MRQLYALPDSGQHAVVEMIVKTPCHVYPSFQSLHRRARRQAVSHTRSGHRLGAGVSPGPASSMNFSSACEDCWERLSKQPVLLALSPSERETVGPSEQSDLIQETLRLIPIEISLLLQNMHRSLKNQQHISHLKLTENESYSRVHMLTYCLKELYSAKKSQDFVSVIRGMEEVLGRLDGVRRVKIYCRDTQPKHLSVLEQDRDRDGNRGRGKSTRTREGGKELEYHVIYTSAASSVHPVPLHVPSTSPASPLTSFSVSKAPSRASSTKEKAKAALLAEKQAFFARRQQSLAILPSTSATAHAVSAPALDRSMTMAGGEGEIARGGNSGRLDVAALRSSLSSKRGRGELFSPDSQRTDRDNDRDKDKDIDGDRDRDRSSGGHVYFNGGGDVGGDSSSEEDGCSDSDSDTSTSRGRDTDRDREREGSDIGLSTNNKKKKKKKSEQKKSSKYKFPFQAQEVEGTLTVYMTAALSQNDTVIFSTIATALGRRIYDIYGGAKHMRLMAELHKELSVTR